MSFALFHVLLGKCSFYYYIGPRFLVLFRRLKDYKRVELFFFFFLAVVSVFQFSAKMLAVLHSVLLLFVCQPVSAVFQKLCCTISGSCECEFKPDMTGETFVRIQPMAAC